MNRESIYELQKIDCNCNNCGYMVRDFSTYQKWHDFHLDLDKQDFEKKKNKLIQSGIPELIREASKMRFQFEKKFLINYGHCNKYDNSVSFIPDVCQLETQHCFVHRKDLTNQQVDIVVK